MGSDAGGDAMRRLRIGEIVERVYDVLIEILVVGFAVSIALVEVLRP